MASIQIHQRKARRLVTANRSRVSICVTKNLANTGRVVEPVKIFPTSSSITVQKLVAVLPWVSIVLTCWNTPLPHTLSYRKFGRFRSNSMDVGRIFQTNSSADADNRRDAFSGESRSTNMVPFWVRCDFSLSMWPTDTTRHKSVGYRYVTFILAVCCSSDATGLYISRRYLTN